MARDYFETAALAGEPLRQALVIDAHAHLGANPGFAFVDSSVAGLISAMDRIGTRVACVSMIPGIFGYARRGNDALLEVVAAFPQRIFGYMTADVGYPETIRPELERCLAAGLRATKILSYAARGGYGYDHPNYRQVYEFNQHHGLPLLIHTFSVAELQQLEPQFSAYPAISFILAHTGSADRAAYARLAREYANVHLETCFSACPRGLIEYLMSQGLQHKVLWGSDAIFMGAEQQIGRVLFAGISEAEKRSVLGENAAQVLGLETTH